MKDTEYAFAVSYLRNFENKMLSSNELESLLMSEDISSALKILSDKGFGQNLKGDESYDEILKSELEKIWTLAKEACPKEAPLEVLLYKNDFYNLKTILKSIMTSAKWEKLVIRPCTVEPEQIADALKTKSFDLLPEFIRDTAKEAYTIITETNDGQITEVFLDKAALLQIQKRAWEEKSEFLQGWAELEILIANMKTAARAVGRNKDFIKNALIPSRKINIEKLTEASLASFSNVLSVIEEAGFREAAQALEDSFSAFEKYCDNMKMNYIKKAKMKCFGFEPIMAFLIAKEYELQAVRIILCAKLNNIPTDKIRERLRDMYV